MTRKSTELGKKHMRLMLQEGREQLKLQAKERKMLFAEQELWSLKRDVITQRKIRDKIRQSITNLEKVM